jgi:hypothetical protein
MPRITNVPALVEAEIVDTISHWYDLIGEVMRSEAGRRVVENDLYCQLTAGNFDVDTAVSLAEAGFGAADWALREWGHDYGDAGRWDELPRQVQGYCIRALRRTPILAYPRGVGGVVDNYIRDIGICVMVDLAAERWALPPTRGSGTAAPSAAYFVALVLRKRGTKLKEQAVNRIYWQRGKFGARLAEAVISLLRKSRNGDDMGPNV